MLSLGGDSMHPNSLSKQIDRWSWVFPARAVTAIVAVAAIVSFSSFCVHVFLLPLASSQSSHVDSIRSLVTSSACETVLLAPVEALSKCSVHANPYAILSTTLSSSTILVRHGQAAGSTPLWRVPWITVFASQPFQSNHPDALKLRKVGGPQSELLSSSEVSLPEPGSGEHSCTPIAGPNRKPMGSSLTSILFVISNGNIHPMLVDIVTLEISYSLPRCSISCCEPFCKFRSSENQADKRRQFHGRRPILHNARIDFGGPVSAFHMPFRGVF